MAHKPILMVNPASDLRLVTMANDLLRAGALSPQALQGLLRVHFPDLVVRPRALSDESLEIWYVYREGRWIPPPTMEAAMPQPGIVAHVRD